MGGQHLLEADPNPHPHPNANLNANADPTQVNTFSKLPAPLYLPEDALCHETDDSRAILGLRA